MQDKLAEMQKEVNTLFESDGLTDEVLEKQLEINKLRNEHDIPDEEEKIYEEWVQ